MWVCACVVSVLMCVTSSGSSPPDKRYTTSDNESFSFIDAIRRNLRRNNEDYVVVSQADDVTPFIGPATTTLGTVAVTNLPQHNQYLGVTNESTESTPSTYFNNHPITNKIKRQPRGKKWKRLVNKSKDLIQYVGSSPTLGTRGQPGQLRTLSNMQQPRSKPVGRARSSLHALFTKRSPGPNREPPHADQLDMAPARGAFINDMRGKGIVCHRHILWPEGPKYDSQGNIIMPMYRAKFYDGKDFSQTRKPRVVLPRCCNCCKKSVLGCQ